MNKILFVLDVLAFFGGPEKRAFRIMKGLKKYTEFSPVIASIMKSNERLVKEAAEEGIDVFKVTDEGKKSLKSSVVASLEVPKPLNLEPLNPVNGYR